ncbi:hypothetical protein [Nisaea sediminum]|uniref:hypothetical protein n=1 Tax=Nisaea sediminum TaxID=2775867 RepID=UPI0018671AD6|nr:hypothetical protein [Nisaea sediminum]
MKAAFSFLVLCMVLGFAGSASATNVWELQAPFKLTVKHQDPGVIEYCQATAKGQDSDGVWLVDGVSNSAGDEEDCTILMQDGDNSCEIRVADPPYTFMHSQITTLSDYCNQYRVEHSSNWKAQVYVFKVVKNN